MGRRNKAYYKDLHQQAYDKLVGMQAFGESKRAAVVAGTDKEKIFSFNTYKSYWKHTKYFIQYIKEHHPECTTLKSARKYVNEWLQARADQGLSAWTIQLEAKTMGKLYGISPDDENYFKPPKRNREDIKRSRGDRVRDRHFSKTNNDELIKFCKGTGLRRSELAELRGKDLVTRAQIEAEISSLESRPTAELTPADVKRLGMLQDARLFQGEYFTHVRNGKGGRERLSPIIGPNAAQIVQRIQETPGEEKVWQHVHQSADIHGYRAEYATAIYKAHARAIQDIPYDRINRGTGRRYQSQVYTCRKDEAGRKLDKAAMEEKLTRAEKEVNYQKGLNANLLRISRERANADRSLRPKKEHTGYAVVRSMEKEYRYKISRHSWGKVMLWETVIQSPYSMEFTEEQARKQIRRELLRDKTGGDWLIGKVGIRVSCDLEFEDMIQYSEWWEKNKDENIMMKRKLNLNGRSGYWEVVFYHTRPLGPVPEEMRPCVR